jgi:hypothetical protein
MLFLSVILTALPTPPTADVAGGVACLALCSAASSERRPGVTRALPPGFVQLLFVDVVRLGGVAPKNK